ncbi:hypothetical protein [Phenylobacterium sp.]|nr:hypothetical protein [Phenylobacterium sp.]HLZ76614.1 hypothetical protein [Phenylobacterium sp.]
MALKMFLAAAAAASVAVGFCLPATHSHTEPRSQIQQLEVGRR